RRRDRSAAGVAVVRSEHELRALLHGVDDPLHAERPADFDEERVREMFLRLVDGVRGRFGPAVTYEAGPPLVQYASFFGDLPIPAELTESAVELGVRTSNFGDLATFCLTDPGLWEQPDAIETLVHEDDDEALQALLAENGYDYVPVALLFTEYDGANQ